MSYDWVVNRFTYAESSGEEVLPQNTYVLTPMTLEGTGLSASPIESWQHFQDNPLYVRAVRGSIDWYLRGNWSTLNSQGAWLTARLAIMKMDPGTLEVYEPATQGYDVGLAQNANDEFIWEERILIENLVGWVNPTTTSGGPVWHMDVNVKCNRKIEPLEQLILVLDNEGLNGFNAVTVSAQKWLRTLLQSNR